MNQLCRPPAKAISNLKLLLLFLKHQQKTPVASPEQMVPHMLNQILFFFLSYEFGLCREGYKENNNKVILHAKSTARALLSSQNRQEYEERETCRQEERDYTSPSLCPLLISDTTSCLWQTQGQGQKLTIIRALSVHCVIKDVK